MFGAFASEKWKDTQKSYGGSNSFLFTLRPDLKLLRTKAGAGADCCYQYLNTRSYDKDTHGLGMGGSTSSGEHRLFIPTAMEGCVAKVNCSTFEAGALLSTNANGDVSGGSGVEEKGAGNAKCTGTATGTDTAKGDGAGMPVEEFEIDCT